MKLVGSRKLLAGPLQRQDAAIVGERMQHHGDILACLHHLVEIADAALPHRPRQRTIGPHGVATSQQESAGQICCSEIVVAGDGMQRQSQPRRHMGDKARLAAAGRPLEQDRQAMTPGVLEQRAFIAARNVGRKRGRGGRHGMQELLS